MGPTAIVPGKCLGSCSSHQKYAGWSCPCRNRDKSCPQRTQCCSSAARCKSLQEMHTQSPCGLPSEKCRLRLLKINQSISPPQTISDNVPLRPDSNPWIVLLPLVPSAAKPSSSRTYKCLMSQLALFHPYQHIFLVLVATS